MQVGNLDIDQVAYFRSLEAATEAAFDFASHYSSKAAPI